MGTTITLKVLVSFCNFKFLSMLCDKIVSNSLLIQSWRHKTQFYSYLLKYVDSFVNFDARC